MRERKNERERAKERKREGKKEKKERNPLSITEGLKRDIFQLVVTQVSPSNIRLA